MNASATRPPSTPDAGGAPNAGAAGAYYIGDTPDLDAGAPRLERGELQRLNRRALWFLAGIVGMLVLGASWLLRVATGDDAPPKPPRQQEVAIPDLPRSTSAEVPIGVPDIAPPAIAISGESAFPAIPVVPQSPIEPSFESATGAEPPSRTPTLAERRRATEAAAAQARDPFVDAMLADTRQEPAAVGAVQTSVAAAGVRAIRDPSTLLARGTYLRCVLETRIVTDVPGFTACVVTEPVYALNGARQLLPRGSRVLGRYDREPTGPRIAVVWDRVITPDGHDITMSSPGIDDLGGAGHPGDFDAHWGSRIGSAMLVSMISDVFRYAAAEEGPATTTIGEGGEAVRSPYESTTAGTVERLAHQALDVRRPPTVTIDHGSLVNVYVARDVDFSSVLPR